MVDNTNPNSQFHPYQPVDATPHSETMSGMRGSWKEMLSKDGLSRMAGNVDVKKSLDGARSYAKANPGKVLGGIALAVIGAGLLSGRGRNMTSRMRRA